MTTAALIGAFVPAVSGSYVLNLTINNAEGDYESTATVTITVTVN